MTETFRERVAPKQAETQLPTIRREERELHGVLDSLGRAARHVRTPAESTRTGGAKAMARADLDMRVARNVSELRLDGSTPLHSRFLRLLESI